MRTIRLALPALLLLSSSVAPASPSHGLLVTPQIAALNQRIESLRSAIDSGSIASALTSAGAPRARGDLHAPRADPAAVPRALRPALAELVGAVESADAQTIARALDRAIPALLAVPAAGASAVTATGCDLVDALPALCVGSDADNEYTGNAALLVDLGGDDTYLNAAGGVPFTADGQEILTSVNLDLGGDDTYAGSVQTSWCRWIAQGAACSEGIGILVDVAGDDEYTAQLTPTSVVSPGAAVQGVGTGAGIGALVDLDGDDRYSVAGFDGASRFRITAQGAGQGGFGLLLDRAGNDVYDIDAGTMRTTDPIPATGFERTIVAQGTGLNAGNGIFSDGGGSDRISVRAAVHNERVEEDAVSATVPRVVVQAQGFGTFANGFLLSGDGPTSYSIDVAATGKADTAILGQGSAERQSLSALDDLGGDDSYRVTASQTVRRRIDVVDGCPHAPPGGDCSRATASVLAPKGSRLLVQGAGSGQSVGQLRDRAGDDSYETVARHEIDVELRDHLSSPAASPHLAVEGFQTIDVLAQGGGLNGSGVVVEEQGNDSYRLETQHRVSARATSDHAAGAAAVTARAPRQTVRGQGAAGTGTQFLDLAGTGDRVESTATVVATTQPDRGGAFVEEVQWPVVQGAGVDARFLVLGTNPWIHSSPARPACPAGRQAHRGYDTWTDCPVPLTEVDAGGPEHESYDAPSPYRASVGHVPNSGDAALPTLTMTGTATSAPADSNGQPSVDGVHVPAAAMLLEPSGDPIAGASIHLTLQRWLGEYWQIHQEVDAVTDHDGVARARVPARGTAAYPNGAWRITATYDGVPGELYARHASSALTITP